MSVQTHNSQNIVQTLMLIIILTGHVALADPPPLLHILFLHPQLAPPQVLPFLEQ